MVPFISSRPGSEPGTMSRGIWSSRVMYLASWSRNGMYSPNGTGWVLEYLCPGPVPGRHTMPWLRTSVGSSPSTMAPTSTGTPTASTASWMSALTVGSVNGSMSVEFSGQITMSGAGASPDSTCAAKSLVAVTWLSRTALRSEKAFIPSPGTLPCTAATVTESAFSLGEGLLSGNADSVTVAAVQGNVPGEGMNAF